ncbi:hypothetical protein BDW74DRAFT_177498 [Aspergillus multicolor]|uniref:uncharacterized protein n=1 Tax=Aspergillus multicolor TaxID=41759 RepID=UPI003CCCC2CB
MSSPRTTPTGRPTRRGLGNACHLCRLRKVRCDRAKPACENCRLAGVACVFTRLSDQPRKTVHQKLAETKSQLQKLEQKLRERRSAPNLSSAGSRLSDPGRFDTAIASFQWHLGFCDLPQTFDLNEFSRELLEEIQSQTSSEPVVVAPKWPSLHLVRCALDHYKNAHLYSLFPVVDVHEMARILDVSELDLSDDSLDASTRACLGAFTAFITGLRPKEPAFVAAGADSIANARAVLTLLPDLALQDTNVRALEALLMIALHVAPMGEPQTAEALMAMGVRILFNLRANTAQSEQKSPHLRALFWLFYGFDKENSIRRSRPSLINDADCDLEFPFTYLSDYTDYHFFGTELSEQVLLFPTDLRMGLLKSRIYRLLYSVEAQKQSEARRLQTIRELDQEMGELKASFPRNCQPDDFVGGRVSETLFRNLSMRGTGTHLEYYYCLMKIHAATAINGRIPPPQSSIELCYQAARSTLLYMDRLQFCITPETFWIHADFVIPAVLALHQRLVAVSPSDASYVREDLQILENTAYIYGKLAASGAEKGEVFAPYIIAERFIRRIAALAEESIMTSSTRMSVRRSDWVNGGT